MQTEKQITNSKTIWRADVLKPKLPEGWKIETQMDSFDHKYVTFIRYGKIHHNAESSKLYVVFYQMERPGKSDKFTVRAGNHVEPQGMQTFYDLKSALDYAVMVMETTDRKLEALLDPAVIEAYNQRIAKAVADQQKYEARIREQLKSEY
jgi:hypothetical protein